MGAAFVVVGCAEGNANGPKLVRPSAAVRADVDTTSDRHDHAASGRLRRLPEALQFEGTTLDGRPFAGANLAERPVVFWFWAPWCPDCFAEGPRIAAIAAKYGHRVSFVGIGGFDADRERMRRFVTRTGTGTMTHLDDRSGRLYAHFEVTTVPSLLLVTTSGRIDRVLGPRDAATLERLVRPLTGA